MTIDVDNQELEDLMAELEAQNAELLTETAPSIEVAEPVKPTVEKPAKVVEPVVAKVEEPEIAANVDVGDFDASDLDALAELDVDLNPTKADKLNAEQEVDLNVVFEEAAPVDVTVSIPDEVIVEPAPEVAVEPVAEVVPEKTPEPVTEPIKEIEATPRELNLTPKPSTTKPRADKDMAEAAELRFKPDVTAFQRETKITDATLDQCMLDQASLMAYHTAQHARAEAQLSRVKQKFNILEAGLYDAYRKHFLKEGEKATEKAIENAVRLDTKWAAAHLLLIEAQTYADMHKGFVASLRDRRDMLIQRGADRREELKGQVRTTQQLDPASPAQQQARQSSNSIAERALDIARNSINRAA